MSCQAAYPRGSNMKSLMTLLVTLVVVSWPLTAAAQGNPEDDLKASHKLLVEAAKTGNVSLIESMIHPRATGFMTSQMLVDLNSRPG